jgi:hypothetical protein
MIIALEFTAMHHSLRKEREVEPNVVSESIAFVLIWSVLLMKSLLSFVFRSFMFLFTVLLGCASAYGQAPISVSVDLRDAPRKLLHTTEIIPVRPGAMTLVYPKWIGNEHELGPIGQQAGLVITAHQDGFPAGKSLLSTISIWWPTSRGARR